VAARRWCGGALVDGLGCLQPGEIFLAKGLLQDPRTGGFGR
jgi:hypothetical protein